VDAFLRAPQDPKYLLFFDWNCLLVGGGASHQRLPGKPIGYMKNGTLLAINQEKPYNERLSSIQRLVG
jgi:hypothetical protein